LAYHDRFATEESFRQIAIFESSLKQRQPNIPKNQNTKLMHLEQLRDYCLAKPATTESLPFGPDTLVFKAAGKMFAVTGLDEEDLRVNLKCDPEYAIQLRERHEEVKPGWHMNKKHWNTVYIEDGDLSDDFIRELIDHSYDLIIKSLTKKKRAEYGL